MTYTPSFDTRGVEELPPAAFSDPGLFQQEMKTFFQTAWISIGIGAQVPNPGDVYPVRIAGEPLLIVRDENHDIQVFHNVCRHRGLQLVDSPCSHRNGLITCPYHTWSYDLDGKLRAAPYWDRTKGSAPETALQENLGLSRVRSALWFDTIFVNLSGDSMGFEQYIAPLARRWESFDANELRPLLTKMDYRPKANWKLVCENFLDGYHLPWVHSQVGPPEAGADYLSIRISDDIFGAFVPRGEKERPRIDRPLPSFSTVSDEFKGSHHFIYIFPNTLLSLGSEWMMAITVVPHTVDESREVFGLYLVGDESQSAEMTEQRDQFGTQMITINNQDMDIAARLQAARTSSAARHCTFAPYWDELAAMFHQRIARELDSIR